MNAPTISKIDIKTNILNVQGVNKTECPVVKNATNMLMIIAKTTTDEYIITTVLNHLSFDNRHIAKKESSKYAEIIASVLALPNGVF